MEDWPNLALQIQLCFQLRDVQGSYFVPAANPTLLGLLTDVIPLLLASLKMAPIIVLDSISDQMLDDDPSTLRSIILQR